MPTPQQENTQEISRKSSYRGKLVAMPSTSLVINGAKEDLWGSAERMGLAIEFPAMPDTIELVRSTDYRVEPSIFLPDGYHQYIATRPLEIPVSFNLHSFDSRYCTQGALTLLQIAARLHSFILPVTTERDVRATASGGVGGGGGGAGAGTDTGAGTGTGTPAEGPLAMKAQKGNTIWSSYGGKGNSSNIYPPVTCWLNLIWTDNGLPGISCVGYVKDVRVVLHGPYLKGPGNSFNLPTWAEFGFTFVHRPGHNNAFGSSASDKQPDVGSQTSAYAHDVLTSFYNTRHLVGMANYKGLDDGAPVDESKRKQAEINQTTTTQVQSLFPAPAPTTVGVPIGTGSLSPVLAVPPGAPVLPVPKGPPGTQH